jgi:hypothetical protein
MPRRCCSTLNRNICLLVCFIGVHPQIWLAAQLLPTATSSIEKLDTALGEAKANGWNVVDMKRDRRVIFSFEKN